MTLAAMVLMVAIGACAALGGVLLGAKLIWASSHDKPLRLTERKPRPIEQDDTK